MFRINSKQDIFFQPDALSNEIYFYKRHYGKKVHYGKKMSKRKKGQKIIACK